MAIYILYLACAAIGIINSYTVIKEWGGRKKRCTLRVPAKVVEVLTMKPKGEFVLMHKPIFETCVMGNDVLINSAIYTHLIKLKTGQKLQIYINPDNPQDFMYASPYKNKLLFRDMLGCVMPLVMLLYLFLRFN